MCSLTGFAINRLNRAMARIGPPGTGRGQTLVSSRASCGLYCRILVLRKRYSRPAFLSECAWSISGCCWVLIYSELCLTLRIFRTSNSQKDLTSKLGWSMDCHKGTVFLPQPIINKERPILMPKIRRDWHIFRAVWP